MTTIQQIRQKYKSLNIANRTEVIAKYHAMLSDLGHTYHPNIFKVHMRGLDKVGREQYNMIVELVDEYYQFQQAITA